MNLDSSIPCHTAAKMLWSLGFTGDLVKLRRRNGDCFRMLPFFHEPEAPLCRVALSSFSCWCCFFNSSVIGSFCVAMAIDPMTITLDAPNKSLNGSASLALCCVTTWITGLFDEAVPVDSWGEMLLEAMSPLGPSARDTTGGLEDPVGGRLTFPTLGVAVDSPSPGKLIVCMEEVLCKALFTEDGFGATTSSPLSSSSRCRVPGKNKSSSIT